MRVEVGSKRQVEMVRSGLRKTWIEDTLLKVRTAQDAKKESFDNRTVIVSGIPKHLRTEGILNYFVKDAGAVVGVELPTENAKLRQLRERIAEMQDSPEEVSKTIDRKRASLAIDESLNSENAHITQAKAVYDSSSAVASNMLAESQKLEAARVGGVVRLVTQL